MSIFSRFPLALSIKLLASPGFLLVSSFLALALLATTTAAQFSLVFH